MEAPLRFIDTLFLVCASRYPEEWIEPSFQIIANHAPEIAVSFRTRCRRINTSQERAGLLASVILQHFPYMERFFTEYVHVHPHHKFARALRDAEFNAFGPIPPVATALEQIYVRSGAGAGASATAARLALAERLFVNRAFNILMGGLTLIAAVRDNSLWLLHKVFAQRLRQPPGRTFSKMLWAIVRLSVILSRNAVFATLMEYPHIAGLITQTRWNELAIIACNKIPTRMHGGIYRFDEEFSWAEMEYRTQEDIIMVQNVLAETHAPPIAALESAINSDNFDILRVFRLSYGQILMGQTPSVLVSFESRIGANCSPAVVSLMADWYPLNPSRILWVATRMQRGPIIEKLLNSGSGVASIMRHPAHVRHIAACSIRAGINSPQFSKIAFALMEHHEIAANNNEFLFSILWHLIHEERLDEASDSAILEHSLIADLTPILLKKNIVVLAEPCYPRSFMRFRTYEDLVVGTSTHYVDASAYYYDPESEHDRILVSEYGFGRFKKREKRIHHLMEQLILPARFALIRSEKMCLVPFRDELIARVCTRRDHV